MISLEKGEHIVLEVRKHWFIIFSELFICFILAILPIFILPILDFIGLKINVASFSLYLFFYTLWILILWTSVFVFWTNYYLDVWIVTDHKIFDINQISLFSREISVLHFEKIQDIKYEITGVIASLLNFGNIVVQTAGTEKNFMMCGVKDPITVQKKINEVFHMCKTNYLPNGGFANNFNNLV